MNLFSSVVDSFAFFFDMISEVLQEDDRSICRILAGGFHLGADAIVQERH